jgi:hypothetical protein
MGQSFSISKLAARGWHETIFTVYRFCRYTLALQRWDTTPVSPLRLSNPNKPSPPPAFTPEPPRVQTQMQRTPPARPKVHPNTSIFETDLDNPHRGLFGSFGASLRHAVSHDSNSRENHTGAPDVQTKRLSYPWEHFDPSNPSAYLFGRRLHRLPRINQSRRSWRWGQWGISMSRRPMPLRPRW